MKILTDWSLHLDVDLILHWQGVDPTRARQRNSPLLGLAEAALELGRPLIKPSALVNVVPVEAFQHEGLNLIGGGSLSGPAVARFLAPSQEIALSICTIGAQLEMIINETIKSEPGLGLSLEGLANGAMENLGTQVCRYFEREANQRGWQCSFPVSPGMCGWSLAEAQKQVFALMDSTLVGVNLTDNAVMLPLKSASMVLGLGPNISMLGSPCDFCNLQETCRYRHANTAGREIPVF